MIECQLNKNSASVNQNSETTCYFLAWPLLQRVLSKDNYNFGIPNPGVSINFVLLCLNPAKFDVAQILI